MKYVNLQKYPLKLFCEDGSVLEIPPLQTPPYVVDKMARANLNGNSELIPVFKSESRQVINMPEIADDTMYIATITVASIVKLPNVVSPFNAVRNSTGQIIGFRGLKQWLD